MDPVDAGVDPADPVGVDLVAPVGADVVPVGLVAPAVVVVDPVVPVVVISAIPRLPICART